MNTYFVTAKKASAEPVHKTVYDLTEAKRIGERLYASGFDVVIRRERGKNIRLVKDERCTRAKRGKARWTR